MSHQNKKPYITGDDTKETSSYRRILGREIGSLEHPYFSTSVRKFDVKHGRAAAMPKFAALMKKNEWRADSSLAAYKRRHERRRSLRIGNGLGSGNLLLQPKGAGDAAMRNKDDTTSAAKDAFDKDDKGITGGGAGKKGEGSKRKREKHGSPSGTSSSKTDDRSKQRNDSFASLDAKTKKQIAEKRKVAKAWFKMASSIRVRSAIVRDGAVKAIALLSTIPDETIRGYCSDSLCELADLPDSRSQMIEDGAAKALLKLCKSPSRATQFSCALALGSLACETGYENDLIEMGVLAELMDKQKQVTEKKLVRPELTTAVARAVFNFACVDEYMMSVQSTSPRLEDVTSAAFVLSNSKDRNVQLLCYRTFACLARIAPLRRSLVKGGRGHSNE